MPCKKDLLVLEVAVINIGLEIFGQALEEQKIKVAHVDWAPPAGGDLEFRKRLDLFLD